jgi:hypothetical protein
LADPEIERGESDDDHAAAETGPGKPGNGVQPSVLGGRNLEGIISEASQEQNDRDGESNDDQAPAPDKQV